MNGVQTIPDGEGDIRLGGYRAGVLSRDLNIDAGVISLGTNVTGFTGTHVVYVGKDAGAQAYAVNDAVFLGWRAATLGIGDGTVAIGSAVATLATPVANITGESVVIGHEAAPAATRIYQSVVLGRRTAAQCGTVLRTVVVGASTTVDSTTCDQVTAVGSNLLVRPPAIRTTLLGCDSTVGGSNSVVLGSGNETAAGTSNNVCIGSVVRAFGNNNIFLGSNVKALSLGFNDNNIVVGQNVELGPISNVTSFDGGAYPGGVASGNTLYLGGCLRWSKLTGNLTFRAGGVFDVLMTPASSLAAVPVSVLSATPLLLSLYSGMVTVTPLGVVAVKKLTTDEFVAGVMNAVTVEATGLVQAKAGLTVTGALLAANAGATCTTLTATGLIQAQLGLTASGVLAANAGATCTTLTATNLVQAQGGLTVTGAALAANAGATCTTLTASGLVQAQAGLTVTGNTSAGTVGCTVLTASSTVTANGVLTANAGTLTTSLEATQLVQAKAGLTVTNGTLTAAHTACTTLQASQAVTALSSVTVTGALTGNGGITGSTISSIGLISAQAGLTVSTGTLTAGNVSASAVTAAGLVTAQLGAVVNGASLTANNGVVTTDLTASGTVTALQVVATDESGDFGVTTVGLKASGLSELADVTADDVETSTLTVNGVTTLSGTLNANGGLMTTNLTTTGIFTATGGLSATGPSYADRFIVKIADPGPQLVGTQAVLTTTLKATQRSDLEELHAAATTVSALTVTAGATLSGAVTSSGALTANGGLTVNGVTTANGDITVNLTSTLKGDVTAEKNLTANRLVANGASLTVGQYALQTTTLRATGDATMAKLDCAALTATGKVLAQNGLDVSTALFKALAGAETTILTATGKVTAQAGIDTTTIYASDDASFVDVDISGSLTVSDIDAASATAITLAVTGDSSLEGDLVVTGSTTTNDLDAQATTLDSLTVTNTSTLQDLTASGTVGMFGTVTVSGAMTMYQTVTASGLMTANAGLSASDVTSLGNLTATGTVAGTGVATVNRLIVNGVSLSSIPTQQYSIEGTSIKATTINASGACEVNRLTVSGTTDPFGFTTLNGFTGTPSINSVSLETGLVKATTVIATSLSTGSGPVSTTGTMTTNALVVTVLGGATWTQALIDPTTTSGLRFSVGGSRSVDLSQAYSPTDGTRKAFCSKAGTGFVEGALVSATGNISTYLGTGSSGSSTVTQDASVPEVDLTTFAGKERYVGVVSSIETGSATVRSQAYGSLVFRTPKQTTDERVVVNTSGFGAVLVNSENGAVAVGDLLCVSNTAGQATKQTGDAVKSWTVGKALQAVTFATSPVLVACKLC